MLFSKKGQRKPEAATGPKDLSPVLHAADSLKSYQKELAHREVEALTELQQVGLSFSGVMHEADQFQEQLQGFGASFANVNGVAEQYTQVREEIGQTALGYDDRQMEWLNKNEHKLWGEIVGRKYLFSSDRQLASSLISPAPFTSVVGPEVPGMAGRFIGHRIIASLLDNRAVALSELLSPSFYESLTALAESKYK